jgi:cell division protein FtsN
MRRLFPSITTLALAIAAPCGAQATTATESGNSHSLAALPRPSNDSLFRRARRLVSEGNGAAGRALVDSLLRAADPATAAYGNALYWHGALAPTAAEAERDYRRVIVEYPLSYYADDALLAIAELEQARGDRAGALQHLQRFVREHPVSPARGVAALGAARLAFEQRDLRLGCAMIADARTSADPQDVELHNQIEYYAGRCTPSNLAAAPPSTPPMARTSNAPSAPTVSRPSGPPPTATAPIVAATAPRQPVPSSPPSTSTARAAQPSRNPGSDETRRPAASAVTKASPRVTTPSAAPAPPSSAARVATRGITSYTIQVAAYNTRPDAERLVTKLASRGVKARVSGTSAPFRVRLALYRTRKEAANEVLALKQRGIIGFVAEEVRPVEPRSP